jgi:hypothetical protein
MEPGAINRAGLFFTFVSIAIGRVHPLDALTQRNILCGKNFQKPLF